MTMPGSMLLSSSSRSVVSSLLKKCKGIIPSASAASERNYSIAKDEEEEYDVIITGGGMVGTTLACAIATNRKLENRSVLLLEGSAKHDYKQEDRYSNRVVALNKQTHTLLASLGAWKHIEDVRYSPIKKMQVMDACSDAVITFNEDFFQNELAYIVENKLLLHAVDQQLSQKENVTVVYNSKVTNVKLPDTSTRYSTIQLQSGKRYRTKLLLGADGAQSMVRKAMNVRYLNWEYGQLGIVATLNLSEPTENVVAWQRFLPTGPIALLPLTDSLSSLVWCNPTEKAKELLKVSDEEFVDRINEALWKLYPKHNIVENGMQAFRQLCESLSLSTGVSRQLPPTVTSIDEGSRAAFPLKLGHAASYVDPGVALVGDAAHQVHPLAGQGVNLGFGDVSTLVKTLSEGAMNGMELGDILLLRTYEKQRQCHNIPTILAIDALHRLYQNTAAPVIFARSLGLQLVNAIPLAKHCLIQHAAGGTSYIKT